MELVVACGFGMSVGPPLQAIRPKNPVASHFRALILVCLGMEPDTTAPSRSAHPDHQKVKVDPARRHRLDQGGQKRRQMPAN